MHGSINNDLCMHDTSVAQGEKQTRESSFCFCSKMPREEKPPTGYPTETPTKGKKSSRPREKKKRGFIKRL
ncbi:hypothetical protein SADUNF_Sadunf16G0038000 [Salix dunnii]|uniref:Uncharacterized protein n=1 Tax=Salix dunnii TaxID=1413687 RepID=A0A835MFK8_9ROSI|nr:hypothetical protein SADUNF_Sadunf16G0038000 [Salix dunnii]